MIDRQLKPMGVNNKLILDAFKSVPRELFLDKDKESIAYHEGNMEVKEGRWLLSVGLIGRFNKCGFYFKRRRNIRNWFLYRICYSHFRKIIIFSCRCRAR